MILNKVIITLLLSTSIAQADEAVCLSKVLYSEAQGESIEGIIALGQATVSRSKRTHKSICKVQGARCYAQKSRQAPGALLDYACKNHHP